MFSMTVLSIVKAVKVAVRRKKGPRTKSFTLWLRLQDSSASTTDGLLEAPRHCLRGCKGHTLDLFRIILHHNCLDTLLVEIPVTSTAVFLHFITFLGQYGDLLNEILGHFPHIFHVRQKSHYWTLQVQVVFWLIKAKNTLKWDILGIFNNCG